MSRIWITRTQPWADDSAELFQSHGFTPVVAPLLTVQPADPAPSAPPHDATLIFTSKNGVINFVRQFSARHYPVICVGDATATEAFEAGFLHVRSARGASKDVTALIKETGDFDTPYIHVSGRHVRGTIVQDLTAAGFDAQRTLYYVSSPVKHMPDIDLQPGDIVALYSPKAAETLAGFDIDLSAVTTVSISPATDKALQPFIDRGAGIGQRLIARAPHERAMLDVLKPYASRAS